MYLLNPPNEKDATQGQFYAEFNRFKQGFLSWYTKAKELSLSYCFNYH